ncbi:MAG: YigZ family protein [Eubacteriales bacterium]|nr:YigZ family protein [Eubacteriales bacterium]
MKLSEGTRYLHAYGEDEVVIKKSRFIGRAWPVSSAEAAQRQIEVIKKEYWDATHNCYAYVIDERVRKCSDDGEPSRTAGMPIMDVITGRGLHHCLVIVTRYFGGILLGTGGLVTAYTTGTNIALDAAEILTAYDGHEVDIHCNYEQYGRINYLLQEADVLVSDTDFGVDIRLRAYIRKELLAGIMRQVAEATSGTVIPTVRRDLRFAVRNGEVILPDGK